MHSVGLTMSKAKRRPGHPLEKVIPSNRDDPPTAAAPLPTPKKEPAIQATNLPGLSDEDRQLFRQATRLVTPLNVAERYDSQPPLSHASASQLAQRRQQAMGPSINAPVSHLSDEYRHPATEGSNHEFLRAGQTPKLLRQLRRGKRWPQASIDLHGYTVAQARDQLQQFLADSLAQELRCIHIVHGKGYGSKNSHAVLKRQVRSWLTQYPDILAYTECPDALGGAGAVLAVLRKSPAKTSY